MKFTLLKTEEPKKIKAIYEGTKFIELWQNKDADFFWLKMKENDTVRCTFGWSRYELANESYNRKQLEILGENND